MKKVIKLVVLAIVVIFVIMVVKDISKNPIQKKETSSEEIPVILDADALQLNRGKSRKTLTTCSKCSISL